MKLHFVHRVCVVLCCPTPSPALSSSPPPRLILSIARSPRLFPSKRLRVPRFRREAPPIFSSILDTRHAARINSPPEFQGRFRPTRDRFLALALFKSSRSDRASSGPNSLVRSGFEFPRPTARA